MDFNKSKNKKTVTQFKGKNNKKGGNKNNNNNNKKVEMRTSF